MWPGAAKVNGINGSALFICLLGCTVGIGGQDAGSEMYDIIGDVNSLRVLTTQKQVAHRIATCETAVLSPKVAVLSGLAAART